MMKLIVGLGNPGIEYEKSRHNTGFIMLDFVLGKEIGKKNDWIKDSKTKSLFCKNSVGEKSAFFLKPETFMNNSGGAVASVKEKNKIPLKDIVIIYDDIDLPLGKMKISYDKNSGGHNGLESVIKKLKTKEFVRIRIGISPETSNGKLRKPKGEEKVLKFLLGDFKKEELAELKKLSKKVKEALEIIFTESKEKAMSLYNS